MSVRASPSGTRPKSRRRHSMASTGPTTLSRGRGGVRVRVGVGVEVGVEVGARLGVRAKARARERERVGGVRVGGRVRARPTLSCSGRVTGLP